MTLIFFRRAAVESGEGRVEDGRRQTLVLGQQVVSELVKIADAADARGPGDDLVHVGHQRRQQADVLGVALDEAIGGMFERCLLERAVLGEIVEADHFVAGLQQLFHQIAADEAGRAGDQYFHANSARWLIADGRSPTAFWIVPVMSRIGWRHVRSR